MTRANALKPKRSFRAYPRETIALLALGSAAALAIAGVSGATPISFGVETPEISATVDLPPAPPPMLVRDVAPGDAQRINASIPITDLDVVPAKAFALGNASGEVRARALECLTSAIYYEAARESDAGQRGVAQVVLNRVRHPAFPNSVCGVVYEGSTRNTGCQFTFTCDGSLARRPEPALWDRARKVAAAALGGQIYAPVGNATHYHADYVVPYWASSLVKTRVEGAHIFYRWSGNWGKPGAFDDRWAGREGDPALLRQTALSVPRHVTPLTPADADPAITALAEAGATVSNDKGRMRVLFTPEARAAVEKAAVAATPYVERSEASDNLRYALGDTTEAAGPALGSSTK